MAGAGKLHKFPEFGQLKKWDCLDNQSAKLVEKYLAQKKNIVILGGKNSGKNTFYHSLVHYAYRMHNDPLVIPPVEGVNLKNYFKTAAWGKVKTMARGQQQFIATIGHNGSVTDIYPFLKAAGAQVDVIIDLRNTGHKRTVCQIYEHKGSQWVMPYFNTKYYNPVKAKFTA